MSPHPYPPGGCALADKTKCTLPYATCCDHGRSIRWPRCNCPLGCNAPTQQSPAECPFHAAEHRARLAAPTDTEVS